jgi:hypothetical protein
MYVMEHRDLKIRVTAAALAAAASALAVLIVVSQGVPSPVWLLITLSAAYAILDTAAVKVGERLYVSSSAMVLFTAAVVFGRDQALAAAAVMSLATVLQPDLFKPDRRVFAVVNSGQIVLASVAAISVFSFFLPAAPAGRGDVGLVVLGAATGAVIHASLNLGFVALLTRIFYPGRPLPIGWDHLRSNVTLAALGVLGGLLGAAYVLGGAVILPLLFVTYLVGHVGFRVDAQMREAHESTIRGVVRALEALDPFTRGHAERVAQFCELAAGRLGLEMRRRDLLRWAAYVHDIGKVAVPLEMLRAHRALEPAEELRMIRLMAVAEDVMADVRFLAPVVDVVRGRHALLAGGHAGPQPLEARILAAADLFDTLTSARSYRAAVTQPQAFAQLRAASERLGGEVVEALVSAIRDSGEVYGSPDEESAAAVDRLVKERAIRA